MPRRTRAESEATAAALLEAARGLFAERGYAGVGLEEVAAAAGVTRGAVYHHFGTKLGLFEAVVAATQAEVGAEVGAAADAATASGADAWAAFETGCRAFLAACLDPRRRRVLLLDAPAVLGWSTWRGQDAEHAARHLEDALAGLAAAGLIAVPSLPAATALLSGAMNEAALWAAESGDPDAVDRAGDTLAVLLAGLHRTGTRSA